MKRIIGFASAALMGASMMVAPALAESSGTHDRNVETPGMTDTNPTAPGGAAATPDVDPGTTQAIAPTFDSALTAISGNETSAQAIGSITEVNEVNIVRVNELEGHDASAVEEAVSQNEEGVDELRQSIEANAALSQELETQGIEASSVVAAQVNADGGLTVYVM